MRILVSTVIILISLQTQIARSANGPKKKTRAPCRRCIGRVVPRAENFGDLITADHKVLSDNCESRNNHRYAVLVQDLATQWIQAYPCKNKTSQETQRSLQKFLEPERKPKVIYTDNSLEFGKACEDLSWNKNSVYKEFLEIVGNGNPTGSVLKETIVVSVTMFFNVAK